MHRSLRLLGITFLLCLQVCIAQAQEPESVKRIRTAYNHVGTEIAACTLAEEPCGYYLNTIHVNRHGGPWAAVGVFDQQLDLWYRWAEQEGEDGPAPSLVKGIRTTHRSNRTEHEEWLYSPENTLMFYYYKESEGDVVTQEYRYYFADGVLQHYLEKVAPDAEAYRAWSRSEQVAVKKGAMELQSLLQQTLK